MHGQCIAGSTVIRWRKQLGALSGLVLITVAGCGGGTTSPDPASTSEARGSGSSGAEESGSTALVPASSGSLGSDSETAGPADCGAVAWEDVVAACGAAGGEPGCGAASVEVGQLASSHGAPCFRCVWVDWVPTTIDSRGVCSYGVPSTSCEAEAIAEIGCFEAQGPCSNGDALLFRPVAAGGVELVNAPICTPTDEPCFVSGEPVVPECSCGCDPAFPGL